jgi:hypothetical protein
MKRMILFFVIGFFCVNGNLRAMSVYNAMSNAIVNFGTLLETPDDFPLIGKLTNILPFGMLATACKQYPGQTMMVCAGLLVYILSQKNNILKQLSSKQVYNATNDDSLFIFDGDDEDDQQPPFIEATKNKSKIKFV